MTTFETIKSAYFATVRRASLSYYTRTERLMRQGAARRYRVAMRRAGYPNAMGC